jgi:hypothetical protein
MAGGLWLSAKAKAIVERLARHSCYFISGKILTKENLRPIPRDFYYAYTRTSFKYIGPHLPHMIIPQHQRRILVFREVWTAFAEEEDAQNAAKKYPIFLFDKRKDKPVIRYDILLALKSAGLTGTLEPSEAHGEKLYEFETVFPLDPDFR